MNIDSESSDEWATEELPVVGVRAVGVEAPKTSTDELGNEEWLSKIVEQTPASSQKDDDVGRGQPMIIVDMTVLSNEAIHCRHDKNSVNDPTQVSKLRKKIHENYVNYAKNIELLANKTVIPCGSSVYRQALVSLRKEKPGHYFCPIFPPST
jgi:hypothetical protein